MAAFATPRSTPAARVCCWVTGHELFRLGHAAGLELPAKCGYSAQCRDERVGTVGRGGGNRRRLGQFSLGGWLYLCSGACDFLDGRLARITGKSSASGAALDSILDRYSEAAMLIGLAWYYRESWVLLPVLAFLAGSFLVPYVRARGEGLGLHLKVGLMQRPERVVVLGVAVVFSP